jgi:MscS family membrane protein
MHHDGTIEGIGIRSTHIRALTGPVVSIPNEKMVAVEIENIQKRPYIRRVFDITVTYDTSLEKINRGLEIIRDILAVPDSGDQRTHPNVAINKIEFPPPVHFNDLNADSLNIYVSYWFFPPDWWIYMEHAEWVNLQIMERFRAEDIEFAFPTQTIELSQNELKTELENDSK